MGTKQGCPLSSLLVNIVLEVLALAIIRRNKWYPIRKGRGELSLFADDIMLYRENPKHSIKKLPDLINELSKVAGYTVNTQKSVVFLYNKLTERKIKNIIPLTIASKRIKYDADPGQQDL